MTFLYITNVTVKPLHSDLESCNVICYCFYVAICLLLHARLSVRLCFYSFWLIKLQKTTPDIWGKGKCTFNVSEVCGHIQYTSLWSLFLFPPVTLCHSEDHSGKSTHKSSLLCVCSVPHIKLSHDRWWRVKTEREDVVNVRVQMQGCVKIRAGG